MSAWNEPTVVLSDASAEELVKKAFGEEDETDAAPDGEPTRESAPPVEAEHRIFWVHPKVTDGPVDADATNRTTVIAPSLTLEEMALLAGEQDPEIFYVEPPSDDSDRADVMTTEMPATEMPAPEMPATEMPAPEMPGHDAPPPAPTLLLTPVAPAAELVAVAPAAAAPAPPRPTLTVNELIVSVYKLLGFVVLSAIVVGLVTYLTVVVFYMVNRSWAEPQVVSPTDERVLSLSAQFAEQSSQRDKLVAERATLSASLSDIERVLAMEEEFQNGFKRALRADLADRERTLAKLRTVTTTSEGAKNEIGGSEQIANANLSLAEKTEFESRQTALTHEAHGLAATLTQRSRELSYDVLRINQEHHRSLLAVAKAKDTLGSLKHNLTVIDRSLARYDELLKTIEDSPLLRAAKGHIVLASVPYENLDNVKKGAPLFSCGLGMLWCKKVGTVLEVFQGEVMIKHPVSTSNLRGLMVQVQLDDTRELEQKVLFARRAPLFF